MTACFIALYETPTDPEAFSRHYREIHIPLACQLQGLRRYSVSWSAKAIRGEPYYLVAELEWDTIEDLRAAFAAPLGRAAAEDATRLGEYAAVRSMVFTREDLPIQPS